MIVRTKTKKRLIILLTACVLLAGLAGTAVLIRMSQLRFRYAQFRADGIAALKAEDYTKALSLLGPYLRKNMTDTEVMFYYAKARLNVEELDDRHITDGMYFLRQAVAANPSNLEAVRLLITLYSEIGYDAEVITESQRHLAQNPGDIEVLRARVIALGRQNRFEDAFKDAKTAVEIAPLDVDSHVLYLYLMHKTGQPADKVLERAQALRKQHPEDPRFQMIQGVAYQIINDSENALAWLREAANRKPTDWKFVRILMRQFENAGQYDESLKLLERVAADQPNDKLIQRTYAQRLWQSSALEKVIERTATLDVNNPSTDTELVALRGLSLIQLNRVEQAQPLIALLKTRDKDRSAQAWAPILTIMSTADSVKNSDLITACKSALTRDPANAPIQFLLGDAYNAQEEVALAMAAWRTASNLAPSWALPYLRISQSLLASGQSALALRNAYEGAARAPANPEVAVTVLRALAATSDPRNDKQTEQVLNLATEILQAVPDEPVAVQIQVQTLAQRGEIESAKAALKSALTHKKYLVGNSLLRLAGVSLQYKLGLEDACYEQYMASTKKVTPELANTRAVGLMLQNKNAEAIALFDELMATDAGAKNDPTWLLLRARLLELAKSPDAEKAWKDLIERFDSDRRVIRTALDSRVVQGNRDLSDRVIDRMQKISGDNASNWRLARARWLLQSPKEGSRDIARASALLNEVIRVSPGLLEPRLLLARSLENLGSVPAAIEQLIIASELDPENREIKIELARLLQNRGEFDRVKAQLLPMLKDQSLSMSERQRIAALYSRQGDIGTAVQVLEKSSDRSGAVMLAELYLRQGDRERAEKLARDIVDKSPDALSIRFLASLMASTGRRAEAEQVLAKLDKIELPPGGKDIALGEFLLRFAAVPAAMEKFRAATVAAPQNISAWERLIACTLYLGKIDDAINIAGDAIKALPDGSSFKVLVDNATTIREVRDVEEASPFVYALVEDAPHRAATLEVIAAIADRRKRELAEVDFEYLEKLRRIANANPRFLHVQSLLIRKLIASGRDADAIELATRTMQAFPAAVEPAQRAAELLAKAERWPESLGVARVWRQRVPTNPRQADLFIAQALRRIGNPDAALKQIAPYMAGSAGASKEEMAMLASAVSSHLQAGRVNKATELLQPMIATEPGIRILWLQVANSAQNPLKWIETIVPKLDPKNADEQATLALAYHELSQSRNDKTLAVRARKVVQPWIEQQNGNAPIYELAALFALNDNDWKTAEANYRKALQLRPQSPGIQNNLAYIIVKNGGSIDEATKLVRDAIAARPMVANYHDSLATIRAAAKDYPAAIASLQEAIRLEAGNLDWRIHLVEVLLDAGKTTDAAAALRSVDGLLPTSKLSPESQKRLDTVRERLKTPSVASN